MPSTTGRTQLSARHADSRRALDVPTRPPGHEIEWVAIAKGALTAGERLLKGELAIFDRNDTPLTFEAGGDASATFVLGSAVPHRYPLHLGAYLVHTSAEALAAGERHIHDLKQRLDAEGDRRTGSSGQRPYSADDSHVETRRRDTSQPIKTKATAQRVLSPWPHERMLAMAETTSSEPRDPKAGRDVLLTPDNCALILIDHQPFQFAGLRSHDWQTIVNNVVGLAESGESIRRAHTVLDRRRGSRRLPAEATAGHLSRSEAD